MRARSALVYTVLRLLAFLVPLGILLLIPAFGDVPWLAAIFAALIGFSLSLLFLRRPLEGVTGGLAERRATRESDRTRRTGAQADADIEDAVVDAARGDGTAAAPSDDGTTAARSDDGTTAPRGDDAPER